MSNIPNNIRKMWEEAAKAIPMSKERAKKHAQEIGVPIRGTKGEYSGIRDPKTGELKN